MVYLIVGNRINSAAGIFISIVAMLIIIYIRYIRNSIERQSVTYQITSKKVIIRKPYEEIMLPFSSIDKYLLKNIPLLILMVRLSLAKKKISLALLMFLIALAPKEA